MRAPATMPIVVKNVVTGASPLDYFLPKPYDGSFGFTNFAAGPSRPAANALANVFGSVIPAMYKAATAAADARSHVAPADLSVLISMFLLTNCSPRVIVDYSFGLRSLKVATHKTIDIKIASPTTDFALPVSTSHAENNPTKVQV